MSVLFVLLGIAVVVGIGLVSVGRLGQLPEAVVDRTPDRVAPDGPLGPDDITSVRFDVTVRGYRMDEVDALLDRLGHVLAGQERELAEQQRQLDELRGRLGEVPQP